MKKFVNYAHRGASEYAPENTMSAFRLGVEMGANGIETDVQITKDSMLVLFHDDTLTRVTGESGKICDYTFSELQEFWVKKGEKRDKIVKFEDFLTEFGEKDLTFAIELKVRNVAKPTVELLKKYGILSKCILTSFIYDEILDAKKIEPSIECGYLAYVKNADEIDGILTQMKADGIEEFCPEAQFIEKERVEEWHELGFRVRAWGVYDEELMKKVFYSGADGMTVNFPDKLTNLLKF